MSEFNNLDSHPVLESESKISHLAEGIRPIVACVGTFEQYKDEISEIKDIEALGQNVDWFKEEGFGNTISPVDNKPKFTTDLANCTSLIAVGRGEGELLEELSILTHQNAQEADFKNGQFGLTLEERVNELKKKCLEKSIDVVIVGGHFDAQRPKYSEEYEFALKTLSLIVQKTLGFEPLVICGPQNDGGIDIYFDTANRRLYVIRDNDSIAHNGSFRANEINKIKKLKK